MDRIVLIGLNHKTAPVEIRERFNSVCLDSTGPMSALARLGSLKESFYLSTCNRMEVLFTTPRLDEGIGAVVGLLAKIYGQTGAALKPYLYMHIDQDAVRHLFRVACSLDSMVVGEPQILGQL